MTLYVTDTLGYNKIDRKHKFSVLDIIESQIKAIWLPSYVTPVIDLLKMCLP